MHRSIRITIAALCLIQCFLLILLHVKTRELRYAERDRGGKFEYVDRQLEDVTDPGDSSMLLRSLKPITVKTDKQWITIIALEILTLGLLICTMILCLVVPPPTERPD